jgi:hypothetical protein
MAKVIVLGAEQSGRKLKLTRDSDLQVWSGLAWAVADVGAGQLAPGGAVRITYAVEDPAGKTGTADLRAFAVQP